MPPSAYVAASSELLRLDFAGEHVAQALHQIGAWLAGPSELVVMAPLHIAALAVLVRVAVWGRSDPWLRLTAVATLTQHGVNLFFLTYGRYYYLTWLLTLLVVAVWLHDEGIALRGGGSGLAQWMARLAQHPPVRRSRATRSHRARLGGSMTRRRRLGVFSAALARDERGCGVGKSMNPYSSASISEPM